MSKRLFLLISLSLVLGLCGAACGDAIEVINPSFEDDNVPSQITEWTWVGDLLGWTLRDTTGWAGGYWGADDEWTWNVGFAAPDGNVALFNVTTHTLYDPDETCELYQILADANAVIAASHRYTLTFNAIRMGGEDTPIAYGALYYVLDGNDVVLADEARVLTAPPWDDPGYAGWEEIKVVYQALSGAASIGEPLGVKLSTPYPWLSGYQVAMDNVQVDYDWATTAWDPIPADGAEDVAKSPTLKWKKGLWAANTGGHQVYLGTDYTAVDNATTDTAGIYKGARDVNNYPAGTLSLGKVYYWRIDEVNSAYSGSQPPAGPWKGDVWSFEVTGYAKYPQPADGAVDVPYLNLTISWTAGTDSTSHDVYLGSTYTEVTNANTSTSGVYRGNKTVAYYLVPESTSTGLTAGKTYYWRIDERSPGSYLLKGRIWNFKIGEYLVVDDFDGYANQSALWAVWDDYWVNNSGGYIFLETDPQLGRDGNSVRYEYRNTYWVKTTGYPGSWIDAQDPAEFDVGANWTVGGAKALTLYFFGDPCNTFPTYSVSGKTYTDVGGNRLWVELKEVGTDVKYVRYTDVNDMKEEWWHEWNIPLKTFSDAGVSLSNLDRVTIGVGGSAKGGQYIGTKSLVPVTGEIRMDDIRLYPPRCMPEYAQIVGNLNGDCIVDNQDLDIFGGDWLISDYNTPAAPPAQPPQVWYRFDEGSSTLAKNDGSWGSGYNITIGSSNKVGNPSWTTSSPPDVRPPIEACDPNYALDFDGTDGLEIPNTPTNQFAGTQNMTIAMWIKPEASVTQWQFPSLIESRIGAGTGNMHASGFGLCEYGELCYWWNDDYWNWHTGFWPTASLNQWQFVAVAVEPTKAVMYYYNGTTLNSATNTATHDALVDWDSDYTDWIATNSNNADANNWTHFNGKIDDVRLYNKTLTMGEVMGLAGMSGEVYVPNTSPANFIKKTPQNQNYDPNNPDIVNFIDYEVLADNWLSEYLWPPN